MIYILLRNDDPGALSDPVKERKILEMFEKYYAPQVLAVIPNNVEDPHTSRQGRCHSLEENPKMIELLKEYQAKGLIEIAQHGFTHQTNKFRPSIKDELTETKFYQGIDRPWTAYQPAHPEGYSEFNGLSLEKQKEKVARGKSYLEKIFGLRLKTFIFPWNTFNPDCLKILRQEGFRFVPGEDDQQIAWGVCVIGCCNWDWGIEGFRKMLKDAQALNKPVLTQFAYHSWGIDEDMTQKIEDLLKDLSGNKNVRFILPQEIPSRLPFAPLIIKLRCWMLSLERKMNSYRKKQVVTPRYYILEPGYYARRIIRLSLGYLIYHYFGSKKSFLAALLGLAFFVFSLGFQHVSRQWNPWNTAALLFLWGVLIFYIMDNRKRLLKRFKV